jgi:hypothetical protein
MRSQAKPSTTKSDQVPAAPSTHEILQPVSGSGISLVTTMAPSAGTFGSSPARSSAAVVGLMAELAALWRIRQLGQLQIGFEQRRERFRRVRATATGDEAGDAEPTEEKPPEVHRNTCACKSSVVWPLRPVEAPRD